MELMNSNPSDDELLETVPEVPYKKTCLVGLAGTALMVFVAVRVSIHEPNTMEILSSNDLVQEFKNFKYGKQVPQEMRGGRRECQGHIAKCMWARSNDDPWYQYGCECDVQIGWDSKTFIATPPDGYPFEPPGPWWNPIGECCDMVERFGINPGVTWGTLKPRSSSTPANGDHMWKANNCDNVVGGKDTPYCKADGAAGDRDGAYECQEGMGLQAAIEVNEANNLKSCSQFCNKYQCLAFDYTTKKQQDSCRLYLVAAVCRVSFEPPDKFGFMTGAGTGKCNSDHTSCPITHVAVKGDVSIAGYQDGSNFKMAQFHPDGSNVPESGRYVAEAAPSDVSKMLSMYDRGRSSGNSYIFAKGDNFDCHSAFGVSKRLGTGNGGDDDRKYCEVPKDILTATEREELQNRANKADAKFLVAGTTLDSAREQYDLTKEEAEAVKEALRDFDARRM